MSSLYHASLAAWYPKERKGANQPMTHHQTKLSYGTMDEHGTLRITSPQEFYMIARVREYPDGDWSLTNGSNGVVLNGDQEHDMEALGKMLIQTVGHMYYYVAERLGIGRETLDQFLISKQMDDLIKFLR